MAAEERRKTAIIELCRMAAVRPEYAATERLKKMAVVGPRKVAAVMTRDCQQQAAAAVTAAAMAASPAAMVAAEIAAAAVAAATVVAAAER